MCDYAANIEASDVAKRVASARLIVLPSDLGLALPPAVYVRVSASAWEGHYSDGNGPNLSIPNATIVERIGEGAVIYA